MDPERKWIDLDYCIKIFIISQLIIGLLFLIKPHKSPFTYFNKKHIKKFIFNLGFLLILFIYFYVVNVFQTHGALLFLFKSFELTFFVMFFAFLFVSSILLVVNRSAVYVTTNRMLMIWFLISVVIISNGFLIDHYSTVHGNHEGDFLQHDCLGIALYSSSQHLWNLGYIVFRLTNMIFVFIGIIIISIISSIKEHNKFQNN